MCYRLPATRLFGVWRALRAETRAGETVASIENLAIAIDDDRLSLWAGAVGWSGQFY